MDLTFSPPFYQLVEAFFARARAGARRPGRSRTRAKMLRPIDKGADIQLNNGFKLLIKKESHRIVKQFIEITK